MPVNTSFKAVRKGWYLAALLPAVICCIPLLFVVFSSAQIRPGELGESIEFFSADSISNTLWVCFGVLLLSLAMGVGSAYLFAHYIFTGSRFFELAFILPIAVPGYIMAITYSSFFDYGGYFYQATGTYVNIMNMYGLVAVLSFCLYPYIFINALHAFKLASGNYQESARLLGMNRRRMFFKVILPLALPAVVAGSWLTLMETLNDFGAASYYGIRTISTEIFRCWQIAPSITIFLSLCVLALIITAMVLMQRYLARRGYYQSAKSKPVGRQALRGRANVLAFAGCSLFFIITFVLPVLVLLGYTLNTGTSQTWRILLIRSYNSFLIAAIAALVIVLFCMVAGYHKVVNRNYKNRVLNFVADFGYAVPGAVLAVALVSVSTFFDNNLGTVLTGSLFFLIVAYMIRFYTVARQPVENLYQKLPVNLFNAAVNLGQKPLAAWYKIYLPVLLPAFITVFLLVFIDVLKELPITLILRPFNFETLSTSVYGYAKVNESIQQSAPYSLLIITLGVIAVILLRRVEKKYGITQG